MVRSLSQGKQNGAVLLQSAWEDTVTEPQEPSNPEPPNFRV